MSTNDFLKGTEAQARAHYAFMRKQGDATAELGKRIIKKVDQLGNVVEVLIDELSQQEMESLFGICTSMDIGVLDNSDQIKLLSYLKAMTTRRGQTTQQQLEYFFAVKKYLNIGNVADTINFDAVSELDLSRSELKTFFECVCEFLFLKTGSRSFMTEFKEELDYFGFNEKIINETVSTIEKTYKFFGLQGIIEHYSLGPIKHEENEKEKLRIPFFEKAFAIIYNGKEKHYGEYAEMLKSTIEERLDALGVDKPQIRIEDENKLEASIRSLEETRHLIYIGEPKSAKNLISIAKWDFDKFGIRYVTFGEKSIINAKKLKKQEVQKFYEYVKNNGSRWSGELSEIASVFNETIFEKSGIVFVDVMSVAIGWPLLLAGEGCNKILQTISKEDLIKLQYFVGIDSFLSSKIEPYLDK